MPENCLNLLRRCRATKEGIQRLTAQGYRKRLSWDAPPTLIYVGTGSRSRLPADSFVVAAKQVSVGQVDQIDEVMGRLEPRLQHIVERRLLQSDEYHFGWIDHGFDRRTQQRSEMRNVGVDVTAVRS